MTWNVRGINNKEQESCYETKKKDTEKKYGKMVIHLYNIVELNRKNEQQQTRKIIRKWEGHTGRILTIEIDSIDCSWF